MCLGNRCGFRCFNPCWSLLNVHWNVPAKFKAKGATSPEKAMTAEELGLKSWFQEAMQECLGKSGLIVEINGKYYLSEQRLREIQGRIVGSH